MAEQAVRRSSLKQQLRRAVRAGEIGLVDQPIIDLATDRLRGVEALARWRGAGLDVGSVAVNASALQVQDPGFADSVDEPPAHPPPGPHPPHSGDHRGRGQAPPVVLATLQRLRAMGVGISMDDFGTGYSSLVRLRHLPVTELKIDRSFVAELDQDPTLTRLVLSLAGSLGLGTVAEGVETADQLAPSATWAPKRGRATTSPGP